MTSVITVNDGTTDIISPALILGYDTSREAQNIVHDIIGGGIAVTLIRPRPRQGILELFFLEEADAFTALEKFSLETTFTLSDSDRPSITMTFIADGSLGLGLDPQTRSRWMLSVGYQEIEVS